MTEHTFEITFVGSGCSQVARSHGTPMRGRQLCAAVSRIDLSFDRALDTQRLALLFDLVNLMELTFAAAGADLAGRLPGFA